MTDTFTCASCGNTYPKGWTDEEAEVESKALWGDMPASEMAVICDDCFKRGKDAALAAFAASKTSK